MSDAPFSKPRRNRRWSLSRSIWILARSRATGALSPSAAAPALLMGWRTARAYNEGDRRVPDFPNLLLVSPFAPVARVSAHCAQAQSSGGPAPPQNGEGEAPRKPSIGIDSLLRPRSGTNPGSAPARTPTEELHGG